MCALIVRTEFDTASALNVHLEQMRTVLMRTRFAHAIQQRRRRRWWFIVITNVLFTVIAIKRAGLDKLPKFPSSIYRMPR